ncbi:hypothetical protein TcWFU_008628 [Taenia crassiceps]|uniref:Uncharacterized protein n=1 Tax=Taenia crassiceps TaxID=6207 RepID=A0ABR4QBY6_9CEST
MCHDGQDEVEEKGEVEGKGKGKGEFICACVLRSSGTGSWLYGWKGLRQQHECIHGGWEWVEEGPTWTAAPTDESGKAPAVCSHLLLFLNNAAHCLELRLSSSLSSFTALPSHHQSRSFHPSNNHHDVTVLRKDGWKASSYHHPSVALSSQWPGVLEVDVLDIARRRVTMRIAFTESIP